jgi:hypothetical protein
MSFGEHEHGEDGVASTLHSIQAGGQHLVMIARQRIAELMDELDKGDFTQACIVTQKIESALAPLSHAQGYIAIADDAQLIKARELRKGMEIVNVGEVIEVEVRECGAARCDGHVKLKIGEHENEYAGYLELYVKKPPSEEDADEVA